MKLKNIILLAAYILITTVTDTVMTEVRRIKLIIRMYKKGVELNSISDLMKAINDKKAEEWKGITESYGTLRKAIDNHAHASGK